MEKSNRMFKKDCTRCDKTFRPDGKYQKLCNSCISIARKRQVLDQIEKIIKAKNIEKQ